MNTVVYPFVARINDRETLVFIRSDAEPPSCAFCYRNRTDSTRVASGGKRIDAVYAKEPLQRTDTGALKGDPICWACIREKTHGRFESSGEWRAAAARFLNALNASGPQTFYCEIQSLS
jgi:hypothetical protein